MTDFFQRGSPSTLLRMVQRMVSLSNHAPMTVASLPVTPKAWGKSSPRPLSLIAFNRNIISYAIKDNYAFHKKTYSLLERIGFNGFGNPATVSRPFDFSKRAGFRSVDFAPHSFKRFAPLEIPL